MTDSTGAIANLAGYRFVDVDDPAALRDALEASARTLGLLGTILVATEGVNLFLAGTPAAIDAFMAGLDDRFAGTTWRITRSDTVPFKRLRAKVKPEIITMRGRPVRPSERRAPALPPERLATWLAQGHDDEGRALVLLDTRNGFEVAAGTFDGAIDWGLASFGDFPAAVQQHAAELAGRTVVTFCTGGIRCEKAALVLEAAGVPHVHQLDGGILGWFEHVGQSHWHGECFVFDQRRGVTADAR